MDFHLSAEQAAIQESVSRYCKDHYSFTQRRRVMQGPEAFSAEHWSAFADLGYIGVALPEDVGGAGGTAIDMAIVQQEFGRALVLEPLLTCAVLAARTIQPLASAEQRMELLPRIIAGKLIVSLAHAEQTTADIGRVETRAERTDAGGYLLSGRKQFVLGAVAASHFLISARTAGGASDASGVSLFHIEPEAPRLEVRRYRALDGRAVCDLTFDRLEVGASALLGGEGIAMPAIERAFEETTVGLCAEAVGAMDAVIATTADYLKTRKAYGTTLSTYQALQHRLADMLVELELSRSILFRALAALANPDERMRRKAVSAAKAFVGRAGRFVGGNGIQLHGGMGMADEFIIGQMFKRLTVVANLFGTPDFHLQRYYAQ
jgi:alkylation response protein AidB-like acyl-CoA dehydrogenase